MVGKTIGIDAYRGVWVFVEQNAGEPVRVSLELLGKGRELADKLGVQLTAILLGDSMEALAGALIGYGPDVVLVADHPLLREYGTEPYTDIIATQVIDKKPEVLIIGATHIGRDLAPRLSYRLHVGCTADCTGLDIDIQDRLLVSTRPAFGGNVMATIICPDHRPQMSTVRPGVMPLPKNDPQKNGSVVNLAVNLKLEDIRVEVLEATRTGSDGSRIEEAERIIGVGMGIGDEITLEKVRELARLLGAEIGGTRFAVDIGWVSHDRQIGQTGKTVRPELYIACGISGAIQHTAGISGSKLVIAINKDPLAEIFKHADYGIVGEVEKAIPAIIKALKLQLAIQSHNNA